MSLVLSQALHASRGDLPPQSHPVMVTGTGGPPGVMLTWDDQESGTPSAFLSMKCCSAVFSDLASPHGSGRDFCTWSVCSPS